MADLSLSKFYEEKMSSPHLEKESPLSGAANQHRERDWNNDLLRHERNQQRPLLLARRRAVMTESVTTFATAKYSNHAKRDRTEFHGLARIRKFHS